MHGSVQATQAGGGVSFHLLLVCLRPALRCSYSTDGPAQRPLAVSLTSPIANSRPFQRSGGRNYTTRFVSRAEVLGSEAKTT